MKLVDGRHMMKRLIYLAAGSDLEDIKHASGNGVGPNALGELDALHRRFGCQDPLSTKVEAIAAVPVTSAVLGFKATLTIDPRASRETSWTPPQCSRAVCGSVGVRCPRPDAAVKISLALIDALAVQLQFWTMLISYLDSAVAAGSPAGQHHDEHWKPPRTVVIRRAEGK